MMPCNFRCEPRTEDVASLLRTASQAGQFSKLALDQSILRRLLAADFQPPQLKNVDTVLVDTSFFDQKIRGASYSKLLSIFRHVIFVSDLGWMDGASLNVHDFKGLTGMI